MNPRPAQPSPWVLAGEPTSLGDPTGLVTLVDGQTFCLSGRSGDFGTNPTHGVFFADMRVLSQARLLIGGVAVEPLAVSLVDASSATFVGRIGCRQRQTEARLLVVRRRQLGSVWHEQIELRNTSAAHDLGRRRAGGRRRLRRRLRDQGRPPEHRGRALGGGPGRTACCSAGGSATSTARPS